MIFTGDRITTFSTTVRCDPAANGYEGKLVFHVTETDLAGNLTSAAFSSSTRFKRFEGRTRQSDEGLLLQEPGLQIRATFLDHGEAVLAFALEERAHINVWRNKVEAMGLSIGPWLQVRSKIITSSPSLITALLPPTKAKSITSCATGPARTYSGRRASYRPTVARDPPRLQPAPPRRHASPFQLVPVNLRAMVDRLAKTCSCQQKPPGTTRTS
jgi:hypothetical protein